MDTGGRNKGIQIPLNDTSLDGIIQSIIKYFKITPDSLNYKGGPLDYAVSHISEPSRSLQYTELIERKFNVTGIAKSIDGVKVTLILPLITGVTYHYQMIGEANKEIAGLSELMDTIKADKKRFIELKIKGTVKGIPKDIKITNPIIINDFIDNWVNTLPDVKAEVRPRGKPKGIRFESRSMKGYAWILYDRYKDSISSKNKLYELIGYIFVGAGIYKTEDEWEADTIEYMSYREYLIKNAKGLLNRKIQGPLEITIHKIRAVNRKK